MPTVTHSTYVMAGFGAALLSELDGQLPAGSVVVVEEPHAITARDLVARSQNHPCVRTLVPAVIQDEAAIEAVVGSISRPAGVRAVIPGLEYGVVAAAALAEAWGLPGASVGAARALRDKSALRVAAGRAGIPQPAWAVVRDPRDVDDARARFGGECVLKPANRQASLGVEFVGPLDDVGTAWARTVAAAEPNLWVDVPDRAVFLAEQRLRGQEVSVEAIVVDGSLTFVNVTSKIVRAARYPVELGHVVPAELDAATTAALRDATARLVDAVGFRTGMLHGEWMLVDGVPHLIECAGRLPGDRIHRLIDAAYGTSLVSALVQVLAGEEVTIGQAGSAAAILFLVADPGAVTEVGGVETARGLDGVTEVHVGVDAGGVVEELTSSWQRPGHVVAVGLDAAEAHARASRAASAIRISTVPA